jgi:hypothetical protein
MASEHAAMRAYKTTIEYVRIGMTRGRTCFAERAAQLGLEQLHELLLAARPVLPAQMLVARRAVVKCRDAIRHVSKVLPALLLLSSL